MNLNFDWIDRGDWLTFLVGIFSRGASTTHRRIEGKKMKFWNVIAELFITSFFIILEIGLLRGYDQFWTYSIISFTAWFSAKIGNKVDELGNNLIDKVGIWIIKRWKDNIE